MELINLKLSEQASMWGCDRLPERNPSERLHVKDLGNAALSTLYIYIYIYTYYIYIYIYIRIHIYIYICYLCVQTQRNLKVSNPHECRSIDVEYDGRVLRVDVRMQNREC